ncbi:MAG: hypothetical protein DME26_16390 [Verrucomicrobia bacterium]|nr:MAG: hypothetical protein DME26_16390 [Verrucomicrobiota bacterium]
MRCVCSADPQCCEPKFNVEPQVRALPPCEDPVVGGTSRGDPGRTGHDRALAIRRILLIGLDVHNDSTAVKSYFAKYELAGALGFDRSSPLLHGNAAFQSRCVAQSMMVGSFFSL